MNSEAIQTVEEKLSRAGVSGRVLLGQMRFLSEDSRLSPAYTDPRYVPFYYYVGQVLRAESLVEIGLRIGMCSSTFLRSCRTVREVLALQENTAGVYYSPKLAIHNIRDYFKGTLRTHVGKVTDDEFLTPLSSRRWDVALVSEERDYDTHVMYLDRLWENMAFDGTILVDYVTANDVVGRAYRDFCKRTNREPYVFNTRYGVGVVTK